VFLPERAAPDFPFLTQKDQFETGLFLFFGKEGIDFIEAWMATHGLMNALEILEVVGRDMDLALGNQGGVQGIYEGL